VYYVNVLCEYVMYTLYVKLLCKTHCVNRELFHMKDQGKFLVFNLSQVIFGNFVIPDVKITGIM